MNIAMLNGAGQWLSEIGVLMTNGLLVGGYSHVLFVESPVRGRVQLQAARKQWVRSTRKSRVAYTIISLLSALSSSSCSRYYSDPNIWWTCSCVTIFLLLFDTIVCTTTFAALRVDATPHAISSALAVWYWFHFLSFLIALTNFTVMMLTIQGAPQKPIGRNVDVFAKTTIL